MLTTHTQKDMSFQTVTGHFQSSPTFLLFLKPATFRAEHPNDAKCSAKAAGKASKPASCSQNV